MASYLRAACATAAVVVLTGCGTTPPVGLSPTPTPSASVSDASSTPSPSSSAMSNSPSATPTSSPSQSQAADGIVLAGKGIDTLPFGTAEDDVEAVLTAKVGKPDDTSSGPVCELNDATPYGRQLIYGGAVLQFESKPKGTKNSSRTFTAWVLELAQPLKPAMKLAAGYPADTTFAELKAKFPKGKLSTINLGDSQIYVFRTPGGIWYQGDDKKKPNVIGAGKIGVCE